MIMEKLRIDHHFGIPEKILLSLVSNETRLHPDLLVAGQGVHHHILEHSVVLDCPTGLLGRALPVLHFLL